MSHFKRIIHQILLIFSGVFAVSISIAQAPTYTIDNNFNTNSIFKGFLAVTDFHFLNDGRILVGGGFDNELVGGMGIIYPNGQLDNSWDANEFEYYHVLEIVAQDDGYIWPTIYGLSKVLLDGVPWPVAHQEFWGAYFVGGTFNPYTVARIWDIYQMDNGDLLLGGAIANDTLLPNELRGISRIHADGSHDPTFPVLNITPNTGNGAVHRIFRAPDGAWYISGGFTAINGHETNRVAKLTPNFEVDTTFVSPLVYDGIVAYSANIILVDSQSRVWVSGYQMQLQENPIDTIQLIRLLPNGEVDASFLPRKLENIYPDSWIHVPTIAFRAQELINEPGKYLIYGQFNYFDDIFQPCITVVNDAGVIQHNYFQDQGATINFHNENDNPKWPQITVVKQRTDGNLFIGGGFSEFMGEERYSVVKLKQGFVGVEEAEQKADVKIYPNPAHDFLRIVSKNANLKSGAIFNTIGQKLASFSINNSENQIDISRLNSGIYFVQIEMLTGDMVVKKFVKT